MNVDRRHLSNRAIHFLESQLHFDGSIEGLFSLSLDSSDKILTARHSFSSKTWNEVLIAEILCLFSLNKSLGELWNLSYREFESFLRDENHVPLFVDIKETLERDFRRIKLLLLGFGYSRKLGPLKEDYLKWKDLSLVEKNRWGQSLCQLLEWNFILAEESQLHIISPVSWAENSDYILFLETALGPGLVPSPIKVVAVLG